MGLTPTEIGLGGPVRDWAMRLAPGGGRLAAGLAVLGLAVGVVVTPIGGAAVGLLALVVAGFYRDPARTPPETGVVAPADGRVRAIERTDSGRLRVVIFLNLWNVHVVRTPWGGPVRERRRIDGHRRPAFLAAAANNAGVALTVGPGRLVLQAGALARRVRVYPAAGADLDRGDRVGHIAFGSRVTVTLPRGLDPEALLVDVGDRTRAGETRLLADDPAA